MSDIIKIAADVERRINALSLSQFVRLVEALGLSLYELRMHGPAAERLLDLRCQMTAADISNEKLLAGLDSLNGIKRTALDKPASHQQLAAKAAPTASNLELPIVVVLTVNSHETNAVLDSFVGIGNAGKTIIKGGVTYLDLGVHGGQRLIHTVSEMGSGGIGASQQRSRQAIEHWKPHAIVAVGIAFGMDETKQAIGDVLVSKQTQDYELGRINDNGILTPRGDKPSGSDIISNRLRLADATKKRIGGEWPTIRFGLVLSGQKLVDNYDYRSALKALSPEAIGGEMEATGVYVSATEARVDWIVLKAICDWGHSKNHREKENWQELAAKNAARVLKEALEMGPLY